MTVTVFGVSPLDAVAEDRSLALPDPASGLVVTRRQHGFSAEITASPEAFSAVRALTRSVPMAYGFAPDLGDSAELVMSELLGNVVRASPDDEPVSLIVEVYAIGAGVEVSVHDAVPGVPNHRDVALDSAEAMSGRGLHLLDLLTTRWTAEPSPFGKKIRCYIEAE